MYRSKFLDSWNEKQFELLVFLNSDKNNSRTKEECAVSLDVSSKTLQKIVNSLEELSEKTNFFELTTTNNHLSLNIRSNRSLDSIFYELLTTSIKHDIIFSLFEFGEINYTKLEMNIGVSHSTLYRKIDEVNALIEPFNIQITKKNLHGSELQIRRFLIDYFSSNIPFKVTFEKLLTKKIQESIDFFEKTFNVKLAAGSRIRLILYLTIVKKRYDIDTVSNDLLHQYPYFENNSDRISQLKFFSNFKYSHIESQITTFLDEFFKKFDIKPHTPENILFLLFLMGEDIFKIDDQPFKELVSIQEKNDSLINNIIKNIITVMLDNHIINDYDTDLIDRIALYLRIICWEQEIYVGEVYSKFDINFEELLNTRKLKPIKDFILNFFTTYYPKFSSSDVQDKKFISDLVLIFIYAANNSNPLYTIGVEISGEPMYRIFAEKQLINYVNSFAYIQAEVFDKNKHYNLIISNIDDDEVNNRADDIYLVDHRYTTADLTNIEKFINENYVNFT